jgi:hypothetical protein
MAASRGKRVALLVGAVTVLALVAGIVVSWRGLREEWYIWRVSSQDPRIQVHAANALASMKSVRAVPDLIRLSTTQMRFIRTDKWNWTRSIYRPKGSIGERNGVFWVDPFAYAIFQIGPGALPILYAQRSEHPWLGELIMLIEQRTGAVPNSSPTARR